MIEQHKVERKEWSGKKRIHNFNTFKQKKRKKKNGDILATFLKKDRFIEYMTNGCPDKALPLGL